MITKFGLQKQGQWVITSAEARPDFDFSDEVD
jgi:hypothetical protein